MVIGSSIFVAASKETVMAADPRIGHGASIAFTTSEFLADVRSIAFSGETRPDLESTHLGSGGAGNVGDSIEQGFKEFVPGIIDPGQLTIEFWLDPQHGPADAAVAADWPTRQTPETITVTFPDSSTMVTSAGWVSSLTWNVATSAIMEGTMVIELSGETTYA